MKKKADLKKLALMGITGGVMLTSQSIAANETVAGETTDLTHYFAPGARDQMGESGNEKGGSCAGPGGCAGMTDEADENGNGNGNGAPHHDEEMGESDLMSKLDYRGRMTYQSLDDEGKALARQLAGRTCAAHNECAGLNSCKGDNNECAGHGACKGQSGCAFKDKNVAVEVAAKKMAEKRNHLNNG